MNRRLKKWTEYKPFVLRRAVRCRRRTTRRFCLELRRCACDGVFMLLIRMLRKLVPLLLLFALAGCVQVEQTLSLDEKGGGTLTIQYAMSKKALADLEARAKAEGGEAAEAAPFSFDEAEVREDFKEYEPLGITLTDARSWEDAESKYIRLSIRFTSLSGVMQTEFFSDRSVSLKRISNEAYELRQRGMPTEDMPSETTELMREALAGFRATLTMETPTDILETNADSHDVRKATWVFDVDKDASALARAQRMDLWVRFSAEGLSLSEYSSQ